MAKKQKAKRKSSNRIGVTSLLATPTRLIVTGLVIALGMASTLVYSNISI